MKKKAKLPLEFVIEARIGDAILNRIVEEQVDRLVKIGVSDAAASHIRNMLKSNAFISNFKMPVFKVKGVGNSQHIQGDKVEAYIAFLYKNFGYEDAKKYVLDQIKHVFIQ